MRGAVGMLAVLAVFGATAASAQQAEPYAGKTVSVIIGFGPGGGYDMWGRLIARHIGKHLPGKPSVIAQNMPGAGSFVAASHIYNAAPKDGTVFGIIARDAALGPLTGAPGARFDATRFSWLGTPAKETSICIAYQTAAVKTVQDLFEKQLIVGDTGPGTGTRSFPKVLSEVLKMKFKNVGGFPASSDVFLAMERGEVDGICESLDSVKSRRPDWIATRRVAVLFQGGVERNPELKDVPFVLDFVRDDADKALLEFVYAGQGIGRPFVAPPDLPLERLKMLRAAFDATIRDAEFVADVKKSKLDLDPEDGEHLTALIKTIYATPRAIIDKVGALIK